MGKDDYAQKKILSRILRAISQNITSNEKPDFVFLTGDIGNTGKIEEFKKFDDEFLTPLLSLLGTDFNSRIFLVPGNHDLDRKKSKGSRRYDILDEIPHFFDPTANGLEERKHLLERFHNFDNYNWGLEQDGWISSERGYFSKRFSFPTMQVGILCLNTAWFCGQSEEQARLNVGMDMVEDGLVSLEGCDQIFVLGHHPIDWLTPQVARQFIARLSKVNAIYFHGHLHKSQSSSQSLGLGNLRSFQSGCAFDARSDEKWIPRLLLGSFDAARSLVVIQPKKWNSHFEEWVLDTDAFPGSLKEGDFWHFHQLAPESKGRQKKVIASKPTFAAPEGWVILDQEFLQERRQEVSAERIVQYFEGRVPQWEDILSGDIPRRAIVDDVAQSIKDGYTRDSAQITLLLGAGGEGKSTAFLQILEKLLESPTMRILWRTNPEKSLHSSNLDGLRKSEFTWLIASDEGDSLISESFEILRSHGRNLKFGILLACRDTDWIEKGGNSFQWGQFSHFVERRMKGLDETDARAIILAWTKYGPKGLGRLAEIPTEQAILDLIEAARLEATTTDGAFLGAMLRVRVGLALRDHVASLMVRLDQSEIRGLHSKTLLDAFSYIVVPHAYNILFLSKSVLARALSMEEGRVRRQVIGPLGEEAAATATGQAILTRHRAIAEAAMELCSSRFDIDPEDILCDLVRSAIIANEQGDLVPGLAEWRFLSDRIFQLGNQSLGVRLAATAVHADRSNSFLAVKLAQLYRSAGQPEQSVKVFRDAYREARHNRAFYTEWATGEAFLRNPALSAWLSGVSLSDGTENRNPNIRDIGYGLAGSIASFNDLYSDFKFQVYFDAIHACNFVANRIGLTRSAMDEIEKFALDGRSETYNFTSTPQSAITCLSDGYMQAYEQREFEFTPALPQPMNFSFHTLADIGCLVEFSG